MVGRILTAVSAVAFMGLMPLSVQASETVSPTLSLAAPQQAPAQRTGTVPASMPSDRVLGRADAPITIIEYASFTCSHCANFSNQVLPELKSRYIDTGKAKLIFRDLPTAPVQVSASLAAMARCAAPGRFFAVTDYLMAGQEAAFRSSDINGWMRGAIPVSQRTEQELLQCMQDPALRETMNADIQAAQDAGVTGTPTLYVNGQRVAVPSLEGMIEAIEPLVR